MSRAPLAVALAVLCAVAASAEAHVGVVVAKAQFCSPAPIASTPTDGGDRYAYVPAQADASYRLAWKDGDVDPTGKFTFYYVDHELPIAISVDLIDQVGTLVTTTDGRQAVKVYVSCACVVPDPVIGDQCDAGEIPTCADGGARWCDNAVDWDTSAVPDGVYWIAAINDDFPYYVYNLSAAPIRVSHGAHKPPAVVVLDNLGPGGDAKATVSMLVDGEGPLTLDLAWGYNDLNKVNLPLHTIVKALPAVADENGIVAYSWDTSALADDVYFISATISDGTGSSTYSESRYGYSVFHHDLDAAVPDGNDITNIPDGGLYDAPAMEASANVVLKLPPSCTGSSCGGCSCAIGGPAHRASRNASFLLGLLAFSLVLSRCARRGFRSACTG